MMKVDVAVVGNGALGMMSAIQVALEFPNWSVCIVGEASRPYSASTAAGAMVNVYAEIEHLPPSQLALGEKLLELGKSSSLKWRRFLEQTQGEQVKTADDTLVVLKNNAFDFESKNFGAMADRVMADGVGRLETPENLQYFAGERSRTFSSVLRILGEFAMDSNALISHLDNVARALGIRSVGTSASQVNCDSSTIELANGPLINYSYAVVAAGAFTEQILPAGTGMMEMFQGIGTALVVAKMPEGSSRPNEVVRTVNRGGAQCGVHLVPLRGQSLYIGAGNTVTRVKKPNIRFETVSYLLSTVETEFYGRGVGYQFEGKIRVGLRPRSRDGFPLLGPLKLFQNIFVATATNRAGLTWAAEIAENVSRWLRGQSFSDCMEGWEPDRESLLLGSKSELVNHYVESRVGAALEHRTVVNSPGDIARARGEIKAVADGFLKSKGNSAPPGTHPDNWAAANEGLE